jgi:hypothetical protein
VSIPAVAWALAQVLPPVPKFVLVALCERANRKTGQCWPGIDDVAEDVCMSQRSVVTYIAALERNGFVTKQAMRRKNGQIRNNHYWINFDRQPAEWIGRRGHESAELAAAAQSAKLVASETVASLQQADFAHGSPVDDSVDNDADHMQLDSSGPCATAFTSQESLAEPEEIEPEESEQVAHAPLCEVKQPPGFDPKYRQAQVAKLRAAEEARKPKQYPVIEGTRAWNAWIENGHPRTLTAMVEYNGKRYRGWYFETVFPPKSTGPPVDALQASLDALDDFGKEMTG